MSEKFLNTAEIAEYLDVNEKKVYLLVRDAALPATKATGKWLFPRELVDNWLLQSTVSVQSSISAKKDVFLIAGSNDPILESGVSSLSVRASESLIYFARVGSFSGLKALEKGDAHAAAAHLFDPTTGEYNLPFLDRKTRRNILIFPFALREQGLLVRKGNPFGIAGIEDLIFPGIRFVNRKKGTGTRALFDLLLTKAGLTTSQIVGYTREVGTHIEVATTISRGKADAGLGIRSAAKMFGLGFVPLRKERFDILVRKEATQMRAFQILLEDLKSARFKKVLAEAGGYETQPPGPIPAY